MILSIWRWGVMIMLPFHKTRKESRLLKEQAGAAASVSKFQCLAGIDELGISY